MTLLKADVPKNGILPIWQPLGFSTHLITQKVAEKLDVKTAHTGTLDPMAKGVILVLLGAKRLEKESMAKGEKVYEFEIVTAEDSRGFSTDTYDGMGLIVNAGDFAKKGLAQQGTANEEEIKRACTSLVGDYTQQYPDFSAKKVQGKPLYLHKRLGNKLQEVPTKKGYIYDFSYLGQTLVEASGFLESMCIDISKIKGDFRQEEILKQWEDIKFEMGTKKFRILKFRIKVSEGIYIREISQRICNELKIAGFANNITRTANKEYTKRDCMTLEQLFGTKDFYEDIGV